MKLKPVVLALAASSLGLVHSQANTTLTLGDISIASANSDSPDGFTFVLLKDVDASTVIKFTDGSFKSAASATATNNFRGSEDFVVWTSGSALSAGSVIRMVNSSGSVTTVTGGGTATGALNGISSSGDQIFAYQGTGPGNNFSGNGATATFSGTILYGVNLANAGFITTGSDGTNESYRPSQLDAQDASIALGASTDYAYTAVRTGLTTGIYRAALADNTNWTAYSTNQTQSITDFSITSSASLVWDLNGKGTAGTGGAGTWDTTTPGRFSNSVGDTYFHWVNSSTGNDHTAVFGGTAGAVSLASGGVIASGLTFDVNGYTIQSNTLTLAGATPTISVTTAGHSATISSILAGSTGLTKSGAGTLNITGTNSTNIGATSVTAGTLNVGVSGTGTLTSAVTVSNAGSTLGGSGTITGNVTINNGAIIAPGNSPGVMTVAGTSALDTGSIFSWELNSDVDHNGVVIDGTRGTNYDGLTSTNLNVANNAIFRVVLTGSASTDLSSGFWNQTQIWNDIFNVSGTTTNAAVGKLFNKFEVYNGTTDVTLATASQGSFSFNNSTLTWTAVPEPTSALAGLLITAGLLRRRRPVA